VDLARYCVNAVLVEGRSVRSVAATTGRSKSWVQRHVALYRAGGEEALIPAKRGPKVPANLIPSVLEDAIVAQRKRLAEDGLDAGARTIRWHLTHDGVVAPSLSTIHRVLRRRGFVVPQPQKRPFGVGRVHRGRRVLVLVADLDVRVIGDDGVMLRHLELDPSADYQRQDRDTL
jgi:transposase